MHFSTTTLTLLLSLSSALFAAPTSKRATGTSAAVLTASSYDDFSVSAGVSGDALAEVNAKFPVGTLPIPYFCPSNLLPGRPKQSRRRRRL